MGVREVWVVDPETRSVVVCAGTTTVKHREGSLRVPETPIEVQLAEVFKALDEYE